MGLLPRLKAKLSSFLASAEDPRETPLGQRELDLLPRLRTALGEVARSKQQLERRAERTTGELETLREQARLALGQGREGTARMLLERRQTGMGQLQLLERQVMELAAEEGRLLLAEQRLSAQIEAFRARQELISARYTAAEAQMRISEALAGVSVELGSLSADLDRTEERTEDLQARASVIDSLVEQGSLGNASEGFGRSVAVKSEDAGAVEEELRALRADLESARSREGIDG